MNKIFLNGNIVDANKATVPANDTGLLYGMGLFETMRVCNGVVFSLKDHLDRLFESVKNLDLNNTYTKKDIKKAIYNTLEANDLTEARLRLTLTSGAASLEHEMPQSTLLITAKKFKPYPDEFYKNGAMAVLSPYRQNSADPAHGNKTTSYMPRILGLQFAQKRNAIEAFWFTIDNRLAEGCISNVFIVKDSTILTPPKYTPVLPGIVRKNILKIAADNAIKTNEKDLNINDLLDADEVFISNVVMQIMPIVKVEKHNIGKGEPGPVTEELMKLFEKFIKKSCGVEDES